MKEDRKFGFQVGGALALLGGALLLFHRRRTGTIVLAPGVLLLGLALLAPGLLAAPRRGWMAFARLLGRVNTAIFLAIVFFLVLTPLGVVLRLAGRDELLRRRKGDGSSTWVPYPERNRDPRHYEKMF